MLIDNDDITMEEVYEELIKLNREKQEAYGNTYKQVGQILSILFPENMEGTPCNHSRMHLVGWIVGKLCRYAVSVQRGHEIDDSLKDLAAYAALLYVKEKNNGN